MQTRAIVRIVGSCLVGVAGGWGGAGALAAHPGAHQFSAAQVAPVLSGQTAPAPSSQDKTDDAQAIARMAKEEYENCASFHEYDSADFKPFCRCFANNRARLSVTAPHNATQIAANRCMGLWPDSHAGASAHGAQGNTATADHANTQAPVDLRNVPASVRNEQKQVLDDCRQGGPNAALLHDCQCIADRFVKVRMAGDTAPLSDIVPRMSKGTCPNIPGTTKYVYDSCAGYYKGRRSDYVAFCTCTAKETAQNFAKKPYYSLLNNVQRQAMQKCGMVPSKP